PERSSRRTPLPRSGTGPLALLLAPYISLRVCSSPASRQRAPLCGTAKCSHLFRRRPLDFENLRFLLLQEGVHLRYVLMREILDLLEAFLFVVFRNGLAFEKALQFVVCVMPDLAHRDPVLFRDVPDRSRNRLPPFLRRGGERQANDLAVIRRGQSEIGSLNGLFNVRNRGRIPGLYHDQVRIR